MEATREIDDACLCRRLPPYHGPATGALAGAEAMLQGLVTSGRPVMRWYTIAPTALFLGASQAPSALDLAACRAAGIAVLKRAAGGTAVLADDGMLGLDVALPLGHPLLLGDLTQSYRWLGEVWSEALRSAGIPAEVVSVEAARASARDPGETASLARLACFGALSSYEVTWRGRKLVGLAQVRRRYGALFQTAILLQWRPQHLAALLRVAPAERPLLSAALAARAVGLNDGSAVAIAAPSLVMAVEQALSQGGLGLVDDELTPAEREAAAQLAHERYQPLALGA